MACPPERPTTYEHPVTNTSYLNHNFGVAGQPLQQKLGHFKGHIHQQIFVRHLERLHVKLLRNASIFAGQALHLHRAGRHIEGGAVFDGIR